MHLNMSLRELRALHPDCDMKLYPIRLQGEGTLFLTPGRPVDVTWELVTPLPIGHRDEDIVTVAFIGSEAFERRWVLPTEPVDPKWKGRPLFSLVYNGPSSFCMINLPCDFGHMVLFLERNPV